MSYRVRAEKAVVIAVVLLNWFATSAYGQSPPTDLTELSLEQILGLRIINQSTTDVEDRLESSKNRWSLSYRYIQLKFSGHRNGTDDISNNEVLWDGNPLNRTDENFPILTQEIHQQASIFEISSDITDRLSLNIIIPYIAQETKHRSIIPNFERFVIRSEGLGDISVVSTYLLWQKRQHYLMLNTGISLPTGAINEEGDTPAPGANNQLPYTMQLGSGTVEASPGITYFGKSNRMNFGAQVLGTLRMGRNYRGYSLGDRLSVNAWLHPKPFTCFQPSIKIAAQFWEKIDGIDREFRQFQPSFFPAAVADPDKFGGKKVHCLFGMKIRCPRRNLIQHTFEIEGGIPIYQSLNGPQPKEVWRINVSWNWNF